MGSSPSPPPVPSAQGIASAQTGANLQTAGAQATLNQTGQNTPFGSLSYNQSGVGPGGVPRYTATGSLSPFMQQQIQSAGNINPSNAVNQAVGMEQQYLDPYFQQQRSQTQSQLENQGFLPGTEGYQNQMRAMEENQGNVVAGNIAQFEPMAFNQAVQSQQLPLNEALQAYQGQFINTPQTGVPASNVVGAYQTAQNAAEQNYQTQMQNYSANQGGLWGIGAAALKAAPMLLA